MIKSLVMLLLSFPSFRVELFMKEFIVQWKLHDQSGVEAKSLVVGTGRPSQVWPGLIRMLQAEGRLSTCFLLKPCAVEAAKHRHSGVSISSFNATQHLWSGRATALLPDKESEHGTNSRTDASHLIGKGSSAADADTRLLVAHDDSTCNLVRTVLR